MINMGFTELVPSNQFNYFSLTNINVSIISVSSLHIFLVTCICFGLWACNFSEPAITGSPNGYDFNKGTKFFLIHRLEEISGLQFVPGNDTMLMAVNDEEGRIYPVNINNSKNLYNPVKFGKSGDYEDLAYMGGAWYVLQSKGNLYRVDTLNTENPVSKQKLFVEGEYEGLCAIKDTLYLLSKELPGAPEGEIVIYKLSTFNNSLAITDTITIDAGKYLGKKQQAFRGSAIARHPVTGHWYLLSHLSKLMLVLDENFNIVESIKLTRSLFAQPEGIAFNSRGDMFVSNEGDERPANIQRFLFQPEKLH